MSQGTPQGHSVEKNCSTGQCQNSSATNN
jgi:hypothetical protein